MGIFAPIKCRSCQHQFSDKVGRGVFLRLIRCLSCRSEKWVGLDYRINASGKCKCRHCGKVAEEVEVPKCPVCDSFDTEVAGKPEGYWD
jgi:hypothetical protein